MNDRIKAALIIAGMTLMAVFVHYCNEEGRHVRCLKACSAVQDDTIKVDCIKECKK